MTTTNHGAPVPAASPPEGAEPFDLYRELNAFFNATQDADDDKGERAQDAIIAEFARLTAQASELADLRALCAEQADDLARVRAQLTRAMVRRSS